MLVIDLTYLYQGYNIIYHYDFLLRTDAGVNCTVCIYRDTPVGWHQGPTAEVKSTMDILTLNNPS